LIKVDVPGFLGELDQLIGFQRAVKAQIEPMDQLQIVGGGIPGLLRAFL
jgi:hypothetical protein